jgi:glycosyltransferase involved in cell wall biosynthesis
MSEPTIALAMIVEGDKKVVPMLEACLASIDNHVDAIYVQFNVPKGKKVDPGLIRLAKKYHANYYETIWVGNFVEARKDVFSKVDPKYDWIMWLDVDDTVENPDKIKPVLAILSNSVQGLYIGYDYDHDDYGNTSISLLQTRVVRNNDSFAWKSSIDDEKTSVHETLVAVRNVTSVANNEWKVVHHADYKRREASLLRNIEILKSMYDRQSKTGKIDPRIMFYLGTHLYDAYDFKTAKELFADYLTLSGWPEERAEAHVYIGKIVKHQGDKVTAQKAFLLALGENPKDRNAYLELARLEFESKRYDNAKTYLEIGMGVKVPITPMVQFNNQFQMDALMAEVLVNLGGKELNEALKYMNKAFKLRPYDSDVKDSRDRIISLIDYRDNMKATSRIIRKLEKDKSSDETIIELLDRLPSDLRDTPPVVSAKQRHTKPVIWPNKSIAIYVGNSSLGIWGPWSLNEGGIGGSEEAVVRLSRELTILGWKVTVFGSPGERAGTHEGIIWKQYWEINPEDTFDIFIAWRQPSVFDIKFKARKSYLWLHDVIPATEFTEERINNFDRVIFVSQYHADLPEFSAIPKSKKFVSSNGIDPSDFDKYDGKFKRDPTRLIYMSANERGLRILYDIWPDIKKTVPDAKLDVYYGWESFDAMNSGNPERMAWKASMQDKATKLKDVTERGRIGQDDLNKEIFKSGIFAYPCFFPEVNCITAQKAMAGGAIPVTSDYAVLKNIIQFGEQVPMNKFDPPDIERYKKRLIGWLLYPEKQDRMREAMMTWAREEFKWSLTAEGWNREFI